VDGCALRNEGRCPKEEHTCPRAGGGPCPERWCGEP
jgi:hypothetical protein